ncbi:alpha/beta family hydrolase [Polynucleobacter kasalickyi]|uniref:KANL3/Tex30 alpha/beta hydrolase-like domain-containing protein n=1 Tax=Polynucleobacter kasalickyi TaxID=1938817 RepID=A0A1W2C223_9BURK|nr:alpha/beta family hydrolase [Polynucleobacter kasalickyi]SMC79297.1 hypothetical protein SAMN06296008_11821 [Polynucleobacter kasalickyi]
MENSQVKCIEIDGISAVYLGSLSAKKVIIFIGRSNSQKYSAPLERLLGGLVSDGFLLVWPVSRFESIGRFLTEKSTKVLNWIHQVFGTLDLFNQEYLLHLIKGLILIRHPTKWDYFFEWLSNNDQTLYLREAIQFFGNHRALFILSHSAGGIIASSLAGEINLKKIICFGYPFKHPNNQHEDYRTEHLKKFKKPFLIIQGNHDEYGGSEVLHEYEMSPNIEFEFVESNHEYENLSTVDWLKVTRRLAKFLTD